mmetsp:Transcript_48156/g.76119  ORF Transcript_48156/g.76119 Transcript_48156/m.76119 type:complete len:90 (+) Transcript_48156:51-320(+)
MCFLAALRKAILDASESAKNAGNGTLSCFTGLAPLNNDKLSSWLPHDVTSRFEKCLTEGVDITLEDQRLIAEAMVWCVHVKRYRAGCVP